MLERGSIWRRWDLHVHTPGTAANNQFGTWEDYLSAIEAQRHVRVIGVTDYLTLTNYSKMRAYKAANRLPDIDYLIPNIEFRLAPPTDKDTPVNIHVIVSPDHPRHEEHISHALARLNWEYAGHRYSCTPEQLAAFGRAVDASVSDAEAALRKGAEQFKIDFSALRDWYNRESWLKENSIIAVSGNKDGLAGFLTDGGWAAHREEITRFSHVIFSARPGEIDFWLGRNRQKADVDQMKKLGGPKPCVHGSDAHSVADLFKPDNDRFCWIKADTNFDGLRQILIEPGERVYIGPTPPLYHDTARVIDRVKLKAGGEWFDDPPIPLNAGMVSIIGQKGSGKSALAELVAFAAGSWEMSEGSFIGRAGPLIAGMTVELTWADGSTSEARIGDSTPSDGKVRFLSQRFVEHLAAGDQLGEDLVREIEAVIFDALDPTDTLNASNFQELRAIQTRTVTEEGERLRADITRQIQDEIELRGKLSNIPEKKTRLRKLGEESQALAKQLPQAATVEEAKTQADLQAARTKLGELQNRIAAEKQKRQKLVDIRARVQAMDKDIARFKENLSPLLKEAGIPEPDHERFVPVFPGTHEKALRDRDTAIGAAIATSQGDPANPAPNTFLAVQAEIDHLIKLESADKARQERIKTIQTRIAAIAVETARLEAEIAQEATIKTDLGTARDRRHNAYKLYFVNLAEEQKVLEALYKPVHQKLKDREHEQDLQFSIRWEVDLENWVQRGGLLMDQRRTVPYGTMALLADEAKKVLIPAWTSGDPVKIGEAHEVFMAEFRDPKLAPRDYLRAGVSLGELLEWLYDVDHIRLSYGLKYRGTPLEKLSPGTKGIVLLILYLGLDQRDSRPLIVDQPDENLDNESIFALLTEYFRSAKKRRQIMLITHNPNLVVNGDSEQIIVATSEVGDNGLPRIRYSSSSLENTAADGSGMRQKACRILEGGTDAFLRRERRYAISI